ncbi:glycoside hydrolase [Acaromyces ingoldii]|uniref:Glucanase n=1 Tax=Acaromyces ingoldii TaxID=215250 RepID=A0A316YDA9_9BASI|nr:glycoside hydrolase [Acaromyces ingoldii]PWN87161.1 glycoside hydrolase [Acaromyces ingoldii]
MMVLPLLLLFWLVTLVKAQHMGGQKEDKKVDLQWTKCRRGAGGKPICKTMSSPLVIDFNWRWLHKKSGTFQNCYLGNKWIQDVCGVNDNTNRCTDACVGEGGVYDTEYGVRTDGDELTIRLVTQNGGNTNVGARLMMLDGTGSRYLQHMLLDQEVTFDIDVSTSTSAHMDADGGAKAYKSAGASAGLGYADGQCARDLKFINGKANNYQWVPSTTDRNAGVGHYGSCGSEVDVWEGNSAANAFTLHPCRSPKQERCEGEECGGTYSKKRFGKYCDANGCDLNTYRLGNQRFFGYGKGFEVDTKKEKLEKRAVYSHNPPVQGGTLTEVRRIYRQNGKVIRNPTSKIPRIVGNSLTQEYCDQTKKVFEESNYFNTFKGFEGMTEAMKNGMTLVFSFWDDHYAQGRWLDSIYSPHEQGQRVFRRPNAPGAVRGPCRASSGVPAELEKKYPDATFKISNIRIGDIGSTTDGARRRKTLAHRT